MKLPLQAVRQTKLHKKFPIVSLFLYLIYINNPSLVLEMNKKKL